jgi:hypothetical protein
MSHHKIRVEFLVLTPRRKTLFLRWALDGFKRPQTRLEWRLLSCQRRPPRNHYLATIPETRVLATNGGSSVRKRDRVLSGSESS